MELVVPSFRAAETLRRTSILWRFHRRTSAASESVLEESAPVSGSCMVPCYLFSGSSSNGTNRHCTDSRNYILDTNWHEFENYNLASNEWTGRRCDEIPRNRIGLYQIKAPPLCQTALFQVLIKPLPGTLDHVFLVFGAGKYVAFVLINYELSLHAQGLQGVPEFIRLGRGTLAVAVSY